MLNAGYQANEFTLLVQDYPSPLPPGAQFRFAWPWRNHAGRCPFKDADANWANASALAVMNTTVRAAAAEINGVFLLNGGPLSVKYMELETAFEGRRLCENGVSNVGAGRPWSWRNEGAVNESEWINQMRFWTVLTPFSWVEDLHPNYWGQLALRNCLRKRLNDLAPESRTCVIQGPGLEPRPPGQANLSWMQEPKMTLVP